MTTPSKGGDKTVRPFAAVLQEIDAGKAHAVLSDLLDELVRAVDATGRKGKLTVTFGVAPVKAGNTTNLIVSCVPKLDAPADIEKSSVFFHKGGALTREDPNQPTLPLRDLNAANNNEGLRSA